MKKFQVSILLLALLSLCAGITPLRTQEEEDEMSEERSKQHLESVLEESEVLKLLRDQASQQDDKIDGLRRRLNKEINAVQAHFEELFQSISETEAKLDKDLKKIESKVYKNIEKYDEQQKEGRGGWKFPFLILLLLVAASGGLYFYMYQKATKHSHFL